MPEVIRITESHWYVTGYRMNITFSSCSHSFFFICSRPLRMSSLLFVCNAHFAFCLLPHHTSNVRVASGECRNEKRIPNATITQLNWHTKLSFSLQLCFKSDLLVRGAGESLVLSTGICLCLDVACNRSHENQVFYALSLFFLARCVHFARKMIYSICIMHNDSHVFADLQEV